RLRANHGHLAADAGEHVAQLVHDAGEPRVLGDRDDGLLHVERPGPAQLAPDRDAGAGVLGGEPVEEDDPTHPPVSVTRVPPTGVTLIQGHQPGPPPRAPPAGPSRSTGRGSPRRVRHWTTGRGARRTCRGGSAARDARRGRWSRATARNW